MSDTSDKPKTDQEPPADSPRIGADRLAAAASISIDPSVKAALEAIKGDWDPDRKALDGLKRPLAGMEAAKRMSANIDAAALRQSESLRKGLEGFDRPLARMEAVKKLTANIDAVALRESQSLRKALDGFGQPLAGMDVAKKLSAQLDGIALDARKKLTANAAASAMFDARLIPEVSRNKGFDELMRHQAEEIRTMKARLSFQGMPSVTAISSPTFTPHVQKALVPPASASTAEAVAIEAPKSWHEHSFRVTRKGRRLLETRHPRLATKLAGAWEQIESTGPDAFSQAVHSLCELMKKFLEAEAVTTDVTAWASTRMSDKALFRANGQPTYYSRALFLLDGKLPDDTIASNLAMTVGGYISPLQIVKHDEAQASPEGIVLVLQTFESFLAFVLADATATS